jgi:RsiW-degrading membrane proteinase PrsW (M82 family)
MNLLILAIAPIIIIASYIYFRDKYEKEPIRLLLFALLAGALIVVPVLFVEGFLDHFTQAFSGLGSAFWKAFVVAGFTEELFKYLALYLLVWRSPSFNDKFDGIVYAVYVSLGFAGVENILYVFESGLQTGLLRMVTAVPAHTIFGITMGFYFGMAKFYEKERYSLKWKSFLIPLLLHGIYDFILFTGIEWLTFVFIGFLIFLYFMGFRRMKKLSDQSIYNTDFDLMNKTFGK